MFKIMFRPFFKKFVGLFISMTFVSLLSIALLTSFGSTITNLRKTYTNYLQEYGDIDEQVDAKITKREKLLSISDIEDVEAVDARLTIDAYLKKGNRSIISRLFSYNEAENKVFKRYVLESGEKSETEPNLSVTRKFAKNNNFKVGDTLEIGYFNYYIKFHVAEIVETTEGIYPRANNYIWSDNQDFGYLYIDEVELNEALLQIAEWVKNMLLTDPQFEAAYEKVIGAFGINVPDFRTLDENYVKNYANQALVKNKAGADNGAVLEKIDAKMKEQEVNVKSSSTGAMLPYRLYMDNVLKQLKVASLFLPIFFYSVTMVVIGLFMNQIIKTMTAQIGVLMSIGIDKKDIISLFTMFAFLMAITAGLLGVPAGFGINVMMAKIMIEAYSIPFITSKVSVLFAAISIVILVIFAEIATLISCSAIMRITPKDACIANESKRKKLPKWLSKFIDKAPMNIKLGTNSIAQNPRRFFVSTFAVFAALVLILLTGFFYVAKEELIDQSVNRRMCYDAQIYMTSKEENDDFYNKLKTQSYVDEIEDCYYTYAKATFNDGEGIYLECLAIDMDAGNLVNIPDIKGKGTIHIQETGLVLPKTDAKRLGVQKGDYLLINDKQILITDISYQYFHPITYLSKAQMDELGLQCVTSYLINVSDNGGDDELLNYLASNGVQCLTVFTSSLAKDLHGIFNSVNVMLIIMIGFSLGMSFIILSIMSQNALMEQQRQLTVFRAIGFTIMDISNVWTLQSVLQMLLSALIAIPAGAGFAILLFKMCSSASQTYPFILHWGVIGMAVAFVLLVILACHLIAMRAIKKWNIADNTRCRE